MRYFTSKATAGNRRRAIHPDDPPVLTALSNYELFYFFLNFLVALAFAFGFALAAARWGAAFLTKRLNGR